MPDQRPLEGIAKDDSNTLLRQLLKMLRPLNNLAAGGRIAVDVLGSLTGITTVATVSAVTTVTTVTTVSTVTSVGQLNNIVAHGGVPAFDQAKSMNRMAYNNAVRANLKWT